MTRAAVVGDFIHHVTGEVCTILKFVTSGKDTANEFFVTDTLDHVDPIANGSAFMTQSGDLLLANQ